MEQKDRWNYLKKEYKGQEIIEQLVGELQSLRSELKTLKSDFADFALCNYRRSVKSAILNSTFGKLRFPIELFRHLKFSRRSVKSTILNCTFVKLRFPTAHFR